MGLWGPTPSTGGTSYHDGFIRDLEAAWAGVQHAPESAQSIILDAIEACIDAWNDVPELPGPYQIRCQDMVTGRDSFDRTVFGPLCGTWQDGLSRALDRLAELVNTFDAGAAEALRSDADQARWAAERSGEIYTPKAGDNVVLIAVAAVAAAFLLGRR
jgi:hypothetical protein